MSSIYTGTWINWSQGAIRGAVLTLPSREGGYLTTFIATFITVVGAQLWRIISFILHQARSSPGPQDGLHHQQQNILRNTSSPAGVAWAVALQAWYWRGRAQRLWVRTIPWVLFSLGYMLAIAAAAVFSSRISEAAGSTRLLVEGSIGESCGFFEPTLDIASLAAFEQKIANTTIITSTYAKACYGDNPSPLQCQTFPKSMLNFTTSDRAACPFASGTCSNGNNGAFEMTTGLLNSREDLGINLPSKYGVQYRKSTVCAPIECSQYDRNFTGASARRLGYAPTTTIYQYHYGSIGRQNYTYLYNKDVIYTQTGYSLSSVFAGPNAANPGGWRPILDLAQLNADLSMVFIASNSITYEEPNDDPVFGANDGVFNASGSPLFYKSDEFVVPIACTERYQICNPRTNTCTPLVAQMQLNTASSNLDVGLNEQQKDVVARLSFASLFTSIYINVRSQGSTALLANDFVTDLRQYPIPSNQWTLEAKSSFSTGLAHFQHALQEYATGPTNIRRGLQIILPGSQTEKAMCKNQIVNDTQSTTSFSILGLIVVFVLGGFMIFSGLFVDLVAGWLQNWFKCGIARQKLWVRGDKLMLQRQVFVQMGLGKWEEDFEWPVAVPCSDKFKSWELT